jgi:eukaryotic-like serine/threonine-protein kinase
MSIPITNRLGRYEVMGQLGRGAMGVVYQARDPQIDRIVAIKTILWMGDDQQDAQAYRERFVLEAKAAGRLSHRGIVQVYDVGEDPETHAPYIVMEYVAGQPLNRLLTASEGAKLRVEDALAITQELAEALAYAHAQGVVHRDIKPANILISDDGHAKITDFGVAKLDVSNLTMAGHAVGTPAYMAPEQLAGGLVDGRADLFSLGVILYSMLCGFRPFQGRGNSTIAHKVRHGDPLPVSTFDVHISVEVDALVARAIAKNPEQRFQSGAEMASAIRKVRGLSSAEASSSELQAVLVDTRAHVACMGTGQGHEVALAVESAPSKQAAPPPQVPVSATKTMAVAPIWRSRYVLAAASGVLAASLAFGVAAKHHKAKVAETAAVQAQVPTAQPQAPAEEPALAVAEAVSSPEPHQTNPVRSAKPSETPSKSDDSIVQDRVIHFNATQHKTGTAPKLVPAAMRTAAQTAAAQTASVQLALDHSFDDAEVTVWVGDRQVLSEFVHGEKKRVLMFQRTHGDYMSKLQVPAGQHLVRVRVQSAKDAFDQSQSVAANFAAAATYVLNTHCDKKHKEIKLDLAAASMQRN